MDLRALRYFIEVVRQNGFTRAADALHVTQPTISKMVKALEDEFGGRLLLREGRGVQLTDAGQVVYDRGLEILSRPSCCAVRWPRWTTSRAASCPWASCPPRGTTWRR